MKNVKADFSFYNLAIGMYCMGELRLIANEFQIYNIFPGPSEPHVTDAIVLNCIISDTIPKTSNVGVRLLAPSAAFMEHIKKHHPELKQMIYEGNMQDGETA